MNCPECGTLMHSRGYSYGKHQYQCKKCGHWEYVKEETPEDVRSGFKVEGENIFISFTCDHVPTTEEVASQYKVDLNEWEIRSFETTDWQMGRKDKEVHITWKNGKADGSVDDSGHINRVWLHRVNVKFVRRTKEIRTRLIIQDLMDEAKSFAPKYPKIDYPKFDNGLLYEIDIPDIHFGRLTWREESGQDFDIKIAREAVHKVLDELLAHAKGFEIEKILLPLGNDFYNVNNKMNETVHGTPQQEDTRWQKTFRKGRELATEMIDKCSQIAPVDVLIISGNHDEEKMFYMGDALECRYFNNPNVTINNSAKTRKYYLFGKNLLGFTHGYYEKMDKLPSLMPVEEPKLWSQSTYREWHLGDKHHKFETNEYNGVVIRILRALSSEDAWTFNKGLVGSMRAAESFLWHPTKNLLAQFTAQP